MKNTPTLATLADDLAQGRTSARKLVDECIARIADPAGEGIRTFMHVDREAAIAAAEAMDHLRAAKAATSPAPARARLKTQPRPRPTRLRSHGYAAPGSS